MPVSQLVGGLRLMLPVAAVRVALAVGGVGAGVPPDGTALVALQSGAAVVRQPLQHGGVRVLVAVAVALLYQRPLWLHCLQPVVAA